MIDIGINLGNEKFDKNREHVLTNALDSGVHALIMTSTSKKSYLKNIEIYNEHYNQIPLFTTLGLHPHSSSEYLEFFEEFDILFNKSKNAINPVPIVAIGEFGLDYNRMFSIKSDQIKSTNLHFQKASEMNIPCFLHERDAHSDFLTIMKDFPSVKKVVHCFTGNKEQMKAYLDAGAYIGVTGWITDNSRGKELQEAIKYLPLDRLMIETDAPYLKPKNMPLKAKINESAYLSFILHKISELTTRDFLILKKEVRKNTIDFFALPLLY